MPFDPLHNIAASEQDGLKGWQTAGLDAHKKPWMCGLGGGLPSQRCKGFKVFKG